MHDECDRYGLGAPEIAERLLFFDLGPERDATVERLHALIEPHIDRVMDEFYDFLLSTPALKPLLLDGLRVERLRKTQRRYLLSLGRNRSSRDYFEERLHIGRVHERVGLSPTHYLGAYAKLFAIIARHLRSHAAADDLTNLLITLERIFWLDADLALMTYHGQRHRTTIESIRVDPVTGITSRGFAETALAREHERAERFGRPFSMLFIDLDHLKELNDRQGHAAGDRALAEVARCLRESVRPQDLVGRYGGDEFLVGVVEGDLLIAEIVADRIREAIEKQFRDHTTHLTASIGVAQARPRESLTELIARADKVMYVAKSSGRNKAIADR